MTAFAAILPRLARGPADLLPALAVLVPPLALILPLSLSAVLPGFAAVTVIAAWRRRDWPAPPLPAIGLAIAFLAWALASAGWSPAPGAALRTAGVIAGLAASGLWLVALARAAAAETRGRIGAALLVGVVLAVALLLAEALSAALLPRSLAALLWPGPRAFESFRLNRGASLLAILVWPAALIAWRRHGALASGALVAAAALAVVASDSMASGLAIAAGALGGGLAIMLGRRAVPIAAATVVVLVLAAPFATAPIRPYAGDFRYTDSISHRASVWVFAAEKIAERPLAGWGLDASRRIPGGDAHPPGRDVPGLQLMPLHPHDFALQWWLELGLVGALLGAALVAAALLAMRGWDRPSRIAGLAAAAAALAVAGVGYGIWQAWWMATLWIIAVLVASVATPVDRLAGTAA